jgi:hypothetical protein
MYRWFGAVPWLRGCGFRLPQLLPWREPEELSGQPEPAYKYEERKGDGPTILYNYTQRDWGNFLTGCRVPEILGIFLFLY